eukprot:s287_g6.t1
MFLLVLQSSSYLQSILGATSGPCCTPCSMIRGVLAVLVLWWSEVSAHDVPITLGALGAWTAFEPDLLIALVAANLDFRRNFEAPVRDRWQRFPFVFIATRTWLLLLCETRRTTS